MLKQQDWIELLVRKLGCTKKEAKSYYDCVFDYIREQISPEEAVKVSNFGVFKLRKTMAKEQINLVTGVSEIVPEHFVITFKPYFEIEPKPAAIVVDDGDKEVPVVEEPVVEEVVEETAEPVVEEVVEEPVVAEPIVEEPVAEDGIEWVYEEKSYKTPEIKQVLLTKTNLSEADVDASLIVIAENIKKLSNTNKVRVVEQDESFNFEFDK